MTVHNEHEVGPYGELIGACILSELEWWVCVVSLLHGKRGGPWSSCELAWLSGGAIYWGVIYFAHRTTKHVCYGVLTACFRASERFSVALPFRRGSPAVSDNDAR